MSNYEQYENSWTDEYEAQYDWTGEELRYRLEDIALDLDSKLWNATWQDVCDVIFEHDLNLDFSFDETEDEPRDAEQLADWTNEVKCSILDWYKHNL